MVTFSTAGSIVTFITYTLCCCSIIPSYTSTSHQLRAQLADDVGNGGGTSVESPSNSSRFALSDLPSLTSSENSSSIISKHVSFETHKSIMQAKHHIAKLHKYLEPPLLVGATSMMVEANKMVVGTMSTTPKRLKEVKGPLGDTLTRLLKYTILDKIYLNVPWSYSMRKKHENFPLSAELLEFVELSNGRLVILRCHDYGPSTKLLPVLLLPDSELPQDTMIITFDDDRLYEETAIKALVEEGMKRTDAAITIAAWPIDILSKGRQRGIRNGPTFSSKIPPASQGIQFRKTGPVDLVLGFFGVLYRKRFFFHDINDITSSKNETVIDPLLFDYFIRPEFHTNCAWVDDIWFSGHLERLKIPKIAVGKRPGTSADITRLSGVNALSLEEGVSVKQNHDNVRCAEAMRKEYGIWK